MQRIRPGGRVAVMGIALALLAMLAEVPGASPAGASQATAGAAVLAGSGTATPGIGTSSQAQTVNILLSGFGAAAATRTSGTSVDVRAAAPFVRCELTGASNESVAVGSGTLAGGCMITADPITPLWMAVECLALTYARVGVVAVVYGLSECFVDVGQLNDIANGVGVFVVAPTSTPPVYAFNLAGAALLAGADL